VGQAEANGDPQSPQNRLSAGVSVPQFEQITLSSPSFSTKHGSVADARGWGQPCWGRDGEFRGGSFRPL
jgi:hypothetical protein